VTLRIGCLAALSLLTGLALAGPAFAGPPFLTDDPEPVELGHWEVYGFSAGANGHGDTTGLGPSLEVNYGAAEGLQLHFIGGFAYDDPPGEGFRMGLSDTELGAKLRFVKPDEDDWYPQIGISLWSSCPRVTPSEGWARASGRNFCRYGCRKIGATGRHMAAVATGSILGREIGIIGSSAGCCKKSSPKA